MRSSRRAPSATAAPACAHASAVASPIPDEAPVIATTLPSSSWPWRAPYSVASCNLAFRLDSGRESGLDADA